MYLNENQFGKHHEQPAKPVPAAGRGYKMQNPVVNEYLNLAIKRERLRKLQEQNKNLGPN